MNKSLLVRRLNITATHVIKETEVDESKSQFEQLDMFTDYAAEQEAEQAEQDKLDKERRIADENGLLSQRGDTLRFSYSDM